MSFKKKLFTFIIFSISVLLVDVKSQSNELKEVNNKKKNNLFTKKKLEISFLESLSPQVAPQIIPYSGISVSPNRSYPSSIYETKKAEELYENNTNRLKQANIYKQNGNIEGFIEILTDLIIEHNFSLLAPLAAKEIADFEQLIHNLDTAMNYYLYIVNNHFNSKVGWDAYYQLGVVFSKKQHFLEAEKIMLKIIVSGKKSYSNQARFFLKERYLLLAKVAFQDQKLKEAKKYLKLYNQLIEE